MERRREESDRKGIFIISALAALVGGLCCLTPVVLVLVGLASLSVAADLGNVLYGNYRWLFRIAALTFLAFALGVYFRRKGICTLDQARRERNRIINTTLVVLIAAAGFYIFWTYVAVHYFGIWAGLPWAQYDEGWAVPVSLAVLLAAAGFYLLLFRRPRKGRDQEVAKASPLAPKPPA